MFGSWRPTLLTIRHQRLTFVHPVIWIGLLSTISMFGALQRPPLAPINVTYLMFGAVLFIFFVYVVKNKNSLKVVWTSADALVAVILSISVSSTLLANFLYDLPFNFSEASSSTFIGMLVLYFITRVSLQRHKHIYILLSILLLGFLIYSLLGVGLFAVYPEQAYTSGLGEELKFVDNSSFSEGMRLNGVTSNANMFVSIPILALPLAAAMFTCSTHFRQKFFYLSIIVASAVSIFLSFSRSSWLGTAVSLLVLGRLLFTGRFKGALKICAVVLVLVLSIPFFSAIGPIHNQFFARLESLSDDGSLGSRPEMWLHALTIIQQFPAGVGLGNYQEASVLTPSKYSWLQGRSPHNTLVALSVEGSLVVGLAMACLMWMQIREAVPLRLRLRHHLKLRRGTSRLELRRLPMLGDTRCDALLIGISAGFVALWIHAAGHSVHAQISIWVLAACQTSLYQMKKQADTKRQHS